MTYVIIQSGTVILGAGSSMERARLDTNSWLGGDEQISLRAVAALPRYCPGHMQDGGTYVAVVDADLRGLDGPEILAAVEAAYSAAATGPETALRARAATDDDDDNDDDWDNACPSGARAE